MVRVAIGPFISEWKSDGRVTQQQWNNESHEWLRTVSKKEQVAHLALLRMYSVVGLDYHVWLLMSVNVP